MRGPTEGTVQFPRNSSALSAIKIILFTRVDVTYNKNNVQSMSLKSVLNVYKVFLFKMAYAYKINDSILYWNLNNINYQSSSFFNQMVHKKFYLLQ